jgi:hypothetical protein
MAEKARADLVAKMKAVLPGERRARIVELAKEETDLRGVQDESRTALLQSFAQTLVLLEETEGVRVTLAPFRGLEGLEALKKRHLDDLKQAMAVFKEGRPEGIGVRLRRLDAERRRLMGEVSDEDLLAMVAQAHAG